MEKEQYPKGRYQMVGGADRGQRRRTRMPPKRGRIKNEIFASIARSFMLAPVHSVQALIRTGRTLGKISRGVVASFNVCYGGKSNVMPELLKGARL